ncbi:MAG: hypothetical protein FWG29_00975 [Treponema sp.]|nr:hypothetical protein [Treponema sp.]
MRRVILVLVLFALVAGGAFAQFSIGGSVQSNFTETTFPSIDMMFSLEKLDILWGLLIEYENYKFKASAFGSSSTNSESAGSFGLYAGVAPKVKLSGNWSLSFPVLLNFVFGSEIVDMMGTSTKVDIFGVGLQAGGRGTYSLSDHWSLYTGFVVDIFTYSKAEYDEAPFSITSEMTTFFYTGIVQFGFLYKF